MNVNQELKVLLKEYIGILPLSSETKDILCIPKFYSSKKGVRVYWTNDP